MRRWTPPARPPPQLCLPSRAARSRVGASRDSACRRSVQRGPRQRLAQAMPRAGPVLAARDPRDVDALVPSRRKEPEACMAAALHLGAVMLREVDHAIGWREPEERRGQRGHRQDESEHRWCPCGGMRNGSGSALIPRREPPDEAEGRLAAVTGRCEVLPLAQGPSERASENAASTFVGEPLAYVPP